MSPLSFEDPGLPVLADLLDPHAAAGLIAAAIGGDVAAVRIIDVSYRPGSTVTVRYTAGVAGESEPATLVAIHGGDIPEGGVRVSDGTHEVAFWRFPDDPGLPGLAVAMDHSRLMPLLAGLGVTSGELHTRLRAYRPGRRAVVEIIAPEHRVFAKVVRPRRVAELQRIHTTLAPHVPIPRSRGWNAPLGLVFMDAVPGSPLSAGLVAGTGMVPGPGELVGLLDLIAAVQVESRPRPGPLQRAGDHAATLRLLVPEAADPLERVLAATARAPAATPITAHRDFHAAQLLLAEGRLRLVDVDTVGVGTRADDLATVVAQLICLARPGPGAAPVAAYARVLLEEFESIVGGDALHPRIAAALLGFALGPFRVQEPSWPVETLRRIHTAKALVLGELKF